MLNRQQLTSTTDNVGVSIVVPCFNEVDGLPHLRMKLRSAQLFFGQKYVAYFILVDDGSSDATWKVMNTLFHGEPNFTLLRHPANLGIGAAILSGIRESKTEIVCSIDSDCSYDPQQLENLIPMLAPGVDLVTASPYHPAGEVLGVPRWRLFLSKAASHLYRRMLGQKLYTYTSCFRVYRRSTMLKLKLRRQGFLAIAELIGNLVLQGSVIVECPATLATRSHGVSKMKTAQVLFGHLQLVCELFARKVWQTLFGRPRPCLPSPDLNQSLGIRP